MNRLKELRKKANLKQSELAQKSGIKVRTIQRYEQDIRDLNIAKAMTLYHLSKALNCSMEDLLDLPDTDKKGEKNENL